MSCLSTSACVNVNVNLCCAACEASLHDSVACVSTLLLLSPLQYCVILVCGVEVEVEVEVEGMATKASSQTEVSKH